ncbi:MAG TPA: hypothetical protein VJ746_09970 [Nitrospira sp.]|nr:hypothetical protein [Nitrospira sp.]
MIHVWVFATLLLYALNLHSAFISSDRSHRSTFRDTVHLAKRDAVPPPPASQGKILLRCMSPLGCRITIDGEPFGVLDPRASKKVTLEYGEHMIETDSATPGMGGVAALSYRVNAPQQRIIEVSPQPPTWEHIASGLLNNTVFAQIKSGARGLDRGKKQWVNLNHGQRITAISAVCSGFLHRFLLADVQGNGAVFILPEQIDVGMPDGQKLDVVPRDCRGKEPKTVDHQTTRDASTEGWLTFRTGGVTAIYDKHGVLVNKTTREFPPAVFSLVSSYVQIRGDQKIELGRIEDCPLGGTLVPVSVADFSIYIPSSSVQAYLDQETLDAFDSDVRVILCR